MIVQLKSITVLGGGTGTFTVLSGLNRRHAIARSAIVSTSDNGGSSGILRDELGILPPGDVLQAITAMSEAGQDLREVFNYRFENGSMTGHRLGNLILAALAQVHGDPFKAIEAVQRILNVDGKVIPVTSQATHLHAKLADERVLAGEALIDRMEQRAEIQGCYLDPPADASREAISAIRHSQLVVIAPGDLWTSTVPVLLPRGIKEALAERRGPLVYVMNLMTKHGQTDGYAASRFLAVVESYCGVEVDYVLVNTDLLPTHLLEKYAREAEPVRDDLPASSRVVRHGLVSYEPVLPVRGDPLPRSLIRHDPSKLAGALLPLVR